MIPQSSVVLDTQWMANLTAQINAIDSCGELQRVANDAFASLAPVKAAINAEIAQLQPILALLAVPTSTIGGIINWISGIITNVLIPLYAPFPIYLQQLTILAEQVAALTAALQAAENRILNCQITIPPI